MPPRLQWRVELVAEEFIVPRLENHEIDDLFYQEDEIGEFRHTAFMIECGLEEDPPDGPDVPPVPWGEMLLKIQQEEMKKKAIASDDKVDKKGDVDDKSGDVDDKSGDTQNSSSNNGKSRIEGKRPPNRSRSSDEIDTLAIELTTSISRPDRRVIPKRTSSSPLDLFVPDGQTSPASPYVQSSPASPGEKLTSPRRIRSVEVRRPQKRIPTKSASVVVAPETPLSPETRPKRRAPQRGRLNHTRSGTTLEMASAAERARPRMEALKDNGNSTSNRKLMKTRSGNCHKMAEAATKARKKMMAEKAEKEKKKPEILVAPQSPSIFQRKKCFESNIAKNAAAKAVRPRPRPPPLVRSLTATRSGTLHGMLRKKSKNDVEENTSDDETADNENETKSIVYKNGKRTPLRRRSSLIKELKSGSKSSDEDEKKAGKVVYRNGKREVIKQTSSDVSSDFSTADDEFLNGIVDDESIGKSDLSISTNGSYGSESDNRLSPLKGRKPLVSRPSDLSLRVPVRKSSLTQIQIAPMAKLVEKDAEKKKKKKKKKKDADAPKDTDSVESIRKKKKKKKKDKDRADKDIDDSTSSNAEAEKRRKNLSETIYGDVRPGAYPSPSSIRSRHKKKLGRVPSPIQASKELCTDPLAALKKSRKKVATYRIKKVTDKTLESPKKEKPLREHKRPEEWIGGSPKKATKSWRPKTKTSKDES